MHNDFFLNLRQKATGPLSHCGSNVGFCISHTQTCCFCFCFWFCSFFVEFNEVALDIAKVSRLSAVPLFPSSLGGFSLKWKDFLGVVTFIHGFSYREILHPSSLGHHFWMWLLSRLTEKLFKFEWLQGLVQNETGRASLSLALFSSLVFVQFCTWQYFVAS